MRTLLTLLALSVTFAGAGVAQAQTPGLELASVSNARGPQAMNILGIDVEGTQDDGTRFLVIRQSGLTIGQEVQVPGDEAFSKAIKQLYRLRIFSDVEIVADKMIDGGVYLLIRVKQEPRLDSYSFTGIKGSHRDELKRKTPLLRGQSVKPGDIDRTKRIVSDYYAEKGHPLATTEVVRTETEEGRLKLEFQVERGPRVEVNEIMVEGNIAFSEKAVEKRLKETKEDRWWRFWKKETFDVDEFESDKQNLINYYNEKGYYDAQIVSDSTYLVDVDGKPKLNVVLRVQEGPKYHIRDIDFEGNTAYTDQQLMESLGIAEGEAYNSKRLETNLYANPRNTDVSSLYYNRGYVGFRVNPVITVAQGDSLDLTFQIEEGDVYDFGNISIAGNTTTKEHVIRRQLRTMPGYTFSRDAIQRSLRELVQLGYFNPETLIPETRVNPGEKTVDVTYQVEETGNSQLELSGGWGGVGGGLLLQAGFTFNNFSIQDIFKAGAWRPLPTGDGQQLGLNVQVQGSFFQNYAINFTEPWFRGKPHPVGFSISHSRYNLNRRFNAFLGQFEETAENPDNRISITSAQLSYGRQLKWPDDYFSTGSVLGWRFYNFGARSTSYGLPPGQNHALTFTQRFARNSLDNPLFPSNGSSLNMSVEIAPPFPGFIQYHKWSLSNSWNMPLFRKVSLGLSADYGYVGSFNSETVSFERYVVGGTPFDAQGGRFGFGRDLVFARGFPAAAITPLNPDGSLLGGSVLNKYTSELRWMMATSPQFQLQTYGFLDALNTWDGFTSYDPTQLFRATGVGVRIFLPILGMLNMSYGYNLDAFPRQAGDDGLSRWRFQFSLGQSF
ncbi:MAG: outer membrane protein assembly factor BamA [Bacteroidota bacterium]